MCRSCHKLYWCWEDLTCNVLCKVLFSHYETLHRMHSNMKKLTGSFRYTQWDPWLIIAQIVSVQCIVYLSLGLLLTLFGVVIDDTRTLDHVFEYHVRPWGVNCIQVFSNNFVLEQEIQVRDVGGRMVITAFVLNVFIG